MIVCLGVIGVVELELWCNGCGVLVACIDVVYYGAR